MAEPASSKWNPDLDKMVREALKAIRFGTVPLVIRDGLVIQVDKCEKIRLARQGHIHGSWI